MSNRRYVVDKKRLPEVKNLDELILQDEIAYTLRGLDKSYSKFSSVADCFVDVIYNFDKSDDTNVLNNQMDE